jgi:cell division protein FtsZ
MTLYEVDQAANEIRAEVDANANIILGSTFDESLEGRMRVAVVATGIDDEAIVTQQTVVEPARRAAEAPIRRPHVPPRARAEPRPAPEPVREAHEEPRPSFANDLEPEPRRAANSGFNLFGWKRPEARDDDVSFRDIDFGDADPLPAPRRAHDDVVRDPALDEELEIPAFLRRQMNPR